MATFSTGKANLDDGIGEEIEVPIDEHNRLIGADREETSCLRKYSGDVDLWHTEDSIDPNIKGVFAEGTDNENLSESEEEHNEEGIEISVDNFFSSVDNSIDEIITTTTTPTQRKHSCFSRASRIVPDSFKISEKDRRNSPPPPLSLATTFDTATTCSISEEEYGDRDTSSMASRDSYQERMLTPQVKEFSRLSGSDIATIIEEQQQKREQVKQAQVEREQEEIDDGLHRLHDECDSGTDNCSEGNRAKEWLEMEVDHDEVVAQLISEINEDDDNINSAEVRDESGDNSVAIDKVTTPSEGSRSKLSERRRFSMRKSILFWKQSDKTSSRGPLQKKTVAPANGEDAVAEEVEIVIASTSNYNEKSNQTRKGQNGFSSQLVEEKAIVLESEKVIGTTIDQEEKYMTIIPNDQLEKVAQPFDGSVKQVKETPLSNLEGEQGIVARGEDTANDALATAEVDVSSQKSASESVEDPQRSLSSSPLDERICVTKNQYVISEDDEAASQTSPKENFEETGYSSPSYETTDQELLMLPLVQEQSLILGDDSTISVIPERDVLVAPPPSPIRKQTQMREDEGFPCDSEGHSDLPVTKILSISELLSSEDHPEIRAAGPIDMDEVYDHVEQVNEVKIEGPVCLPNSPDSSPGVPVDGGDNPESLPPAPSPAKDCNIERLASTKSSSSAQKTISTHSSSTSSVSMGERDMKRRPSVAHGDFARLKHLVILTMMCIIIGIGVMDRCFDLRIRTDTESFPESVNVVEKTRKLHVKSKERKRKQQVDLDELLSTLW